MKTNPRLTVITAILLFVFFISFLAVSGDAAPGKVDKGSVLETYAKLPLCFIENKGQLDPKVRFYVRTSGQTLYFTDDGIVFDLLRGEKTIVKDTDETEKDRQTRWLKTERLVFNLNFENAHKDILIQGINRQETSINCFIGNDRSKWKTGIPTYKGIIYKDIYKDIDLKIFGSGRGIEYEFIVNRGGNPKDIILTYDGIEGLITNGEGELLIATPFGQLKETRPYIYQVIDDKKTVDGSFEIRSSIGQSRAGRFSYGFRIASYNPSYHLVIDPTLMYSTYLGGSSGDFGYRIAIDSNGNAYVTGGTNSINFPTKDPYQGTYGGGEVNAFITKIDSSGGSIIYSTYLGGSEGDSGRSIAVDGSGNAYVIGLTGSTDFPIQGPYQAATAGNCDAFITKVSPSGGSLIYSTYLGGSSYDEGLGIAVDSSGSAYVTGRTNSFNFPTLNPFQGTHGGGNTDVFITKLDSSGNTLAYSTYLGGNADDFGYGIAVDTSENVYVAGYTWSTNFPTQGPYQAATAGNCDAFITKVSPSGGSLIYSTYLGGSSFDFGDGIAVDNSGNAYVTGYTYSNNFPTLNPYQSNLSGTTDAFVTKLDSSGSTLSYSTYLGGIDYDFGSGIAVNASGNVYITGQTFSFNFPIQDPYQGTSGGDNDAFVTKLDSSGSTLSYSTYLGGSGQDYGCGIVVDGSGNAYVMGRTTSIDFPTQNPFQGSNAGGTDVFVAKLNDANSTSIPVLNEWGLIILSLFVIGTGYFTIRKPQGSDLHS